MKELPALPYREWRDTLETLHRWSQVIGKVQLALTPLVNHWWNVPFQLSSHGLRTEAMPLGDGTFDMELDFIEDVLRIRPSEGPPRTVELRPRSVADFYAATMAALREVGVEVRIWTTPVEIANPIPFEQDTEHASYDREYVLRFWQCLEQIDAVFARFRAGFVGKSSPVQFYWGSFDLTVTRFSGRRAPAFAGNLIEQEGYSHELFSVGWWPGDPRMERAAFYAYASPEPPGFSTAPVEPAEAYYLKSMKGFYLDHEEVRRVADPETMLLEFCESAYAAAAELGRWPRADLERTHEEKAHALFASQDQRQHTGEDRRL